LNSIRVNQLNSDTVVNFIMDELTGNFERAVFELNGEKLNIVVDFEFPAGDTTMILSHYNYNWDTGESELYYAGEYSLSGGVVGETAVFARGQQGAAGTDDWITAGVGVGVGVGIAEIALATGVIAGTGLVGTAAGAVAVAVAGVSSTVILAAVVVGVALATISGANASELVPQNGPIPNGTPPGNAPNGQLPDPLPENPCITNRVFVIVGADDDGTLTAIATGGTGDYTYSWSNGTTVTTSVTFHTLSPETEGTYSVLVNDENGCVATGSATSYTEDVEENFLIGTWINDDNESFDISFYDDGTHELFWDGESEGAYQWSWTDENKTHINWQVDNDGNPTDWIIAEIILNSNTLIMNYEGTSKSFTRN
jgi:hypothetical protein